MTPWGNTGWLEWDAELTLGFQILDRLWAEEAEARDQFERARQARQVPQNVL